MLQTPLLMILAISFATLALGSLYFRRWQLTRPPVGVFDLGDVAFMLGTVVVLPLLYLALPGWLLVGLMALGALSAVYLAAEPILKSAWACWLLVILITIAEGWAALLADPAGHALVLVNNGVILVAVVGVANLWVQSGMKARDAAILGGALCIYDLLATSMLPLMGDLMARVATLPFGPVVAWPAESGVGALIGMGDLLLATMFPLVMRKAYGRPAGLVAFALSCASIVAPSVFALVVPVDLFPVMTVLGPAMVLQYLWWSRQAGAERTTWQYLQAETIV